jgi:glycosyltransferase involved in cell wall biosynthesis
MGKFESAEFEKKIYTKIREYGLEQNITFLGVLTGTKKFQAYGSSDIFCFPSFFEAESFPVVLLEASCFGLPIVSTWWRGIPSIVTDNENGYLVPIKSEGRVAEKLQVLVADASLREEMGKKSRGLYVKKYTLEKFYQTIEKTLATLGKMN